MFRLFKKHTPLQIIKTDQGTHGDHWYTLFGKNWDSKKLIDFINQIYTARYNSSKAEEVQKISTNLVDILIIQSQIASAYPHIKEGSSLALEIKEIHEWLHTNGLEAQGVAIQKSIPAEIRFYITDYFENKQKYQLGEVKNIKLLGMAYEVGKIDNGARSSQPSVYLPYKESLDTYQFVGRINHTREVFIDGINGWIVNLDILDNGELSLDIDLFVNPDNLSTDLVAGEQVQGVFWLTGAAN